MGLRAKFNAVLIGACLAGIAAATLFSYWVVRQSTLEGIEQEIRLIRTNALAVRHYTSTNVGPLLAEDNELLFLPQTVASFSAQTVFSKFQETFPEYYYKEAALNPTNPDDLAEPWEASLIEQFRADPQLDRVSVINESGGERFFTVAFPLKIGSRNCLKCHGSPEDAPRTLIDLYGDANGFGWSLDETIGAQIVSAPMSLAEDRAERTVMILGVALVAAFVLVLIVTNVLLSRIVLKPVTTMSSVAEQVSLGDFSVPEYEKPGKDEISSLSVSFNRMRRSLESAMKLIDE